MSILGCLVKKRGRGKPLCAERVSYINQKRQPAYLFGGNAFEECPSLAQGRDASLSWNTFDQIADLICTGLGSE